MEKLRFTLALGDLPSPLNRGTPPRQAWPRAYGLKLIIIFGAAVLSVVALISGMIWFVTVPEMIALGSGPNTLASPLLTQALRLTGVFIASLFGLTMLFPLMSVPTNFRPEYGRISNEIAGYPFEVRYQRSGWGRSLAGRGTVHFGTDRLIIDGSMTPNFLVLVTVVVLGMELMLILLYLLGIRLSPPIISIIAKLPLPWIFAYYYARRTRVVERIAYTSMRDLRVEGCKVTFASADEQLREVTFYVASSDAERLYRELHERVALGTTGELQTEGE
jgi:hypothetical protein